MVLNGDHLYPNRNVVLCNKKMRRGCHCSLFLTTLVLALQGCASFYFHKAAFYPPNEFGYRHPACSWKSLDACDTNIHPEPCF